MVELVTPPTRQPIGTGAAGPVLADPTWHRYWKQLADNMGGFTGITDNIKFVNYTATSWSIQNIVLERGRPGFEYDTGKFKIGTGSTTWNMLPYAAYTPDETDALLAGKLNVGTTTTSIAEGANLYFTDARAVSAVGAAASFALYGAAFVAQPTTAITPEAFVANTSGIVNDSATFGGYTVGQIVAALKAVGVLA